MAKPTEEELEKAKKMEFAHVQNIRAQYERLLKEYPQCRNLNETAEYWREREKNFK